MEKTNAEIATLAMLLKGINIKAGARKADCRPFIEKLDEHIDAFVKAAVEEGYAESEESHLPEVFPSADMRTAEFEEDIRRRAEYPESLFPMATDSSAGGSRTGSAESCCSMSLTLICPMG